MSFFTSSEQKIRTRDVDLIIGNAYDMLSDPATQEAIDTHELLELLRRYYVPNIRQGIATTPKKHRNGEALPVVVKNPGEQIRFTDTVPLDFSDEQTTEAKRLLTAWGEGQDRVNASIASINHRLKQKDVTVGDPKRSAIHAHTISPQAIFDVDAPRGPQTIIAFGRPLTVFYKPELKNGQNWPINGVGLVAVHELIHVKQYSRQPLINPKKIARDRRRLMMELEAYGDTARVSKALFYKSMNTRFFENELIIDDTAWEVERIREQENAGRRNPLDPTKSISKLLLTEIGLDFD